MPDHFKFNFKLRDEFNRTTAKTVEMRDYAGITLDASLAQALTDAQQFAEDFDSTTKLQIVDVTVNIPLTSLFGGWGLKTAPLPGADVTEVATYNLIPNAPAFASQRLPFSIPSPVDALFVNPAVSKVLDLAASELTALIANFANTAGGEPQLSDGQTVDTTAGSYGNGVASAAHHTRKKSGTRQY